MDEARVLLVGWDAADWKVMNALMDRGLMPTTQHLAENGVMGNLATLSPVLSPMLWTSIATGKRPFKHGILGFTEPTPDGTAVQPVSSLSRQTKAVWNILNQHGKRSLVVGWWPSHPAEPIDGVMVSNHYHRVPQPLDPRWPMAGGTVHPVELAETLAELRLHPLELDQQHVLPFIPRADRIDQDNDRRLATCMTTIAECTSVHACATHLIEHEPWDFAAVYYDAIDHFQHGFMRYHPPRQDSVSEEDFEIYQNVVSASYVYHDMMLGRLVELAGDGTTVILVSDHGFHSDHLRPQAIPDEPAGPAVEHRDLGVLLMSGPGIRRDEFVHGATLLDVTPTILTAYGLAVGDDMDGRPLLEAFETPPPVRAIPSWDRVPGADAQHPDERRLELAESRASLEQLVALGYIDPPGEDSEKAVSHTRREWDYNLALSYIDAGMQPEAVPILVRLYRDHPLEFRFGIKLALCLQALERIDEMARVVDDLGTRWREAAAAARERLLEVAELARQRREEGRADAPASSEEDGEAAVFDERERRAIRSLRIIASGGERALHYLANSMATARRDYPAALELLERPTGPDERLPGLHLQRGNINLHLKRLEAAEACYRRALDLDPDYAEAFLGLARVHLRSGRNREAVSAAETAVGLKYQFPQAHFFLGIARHRTGNGAGAVRALQRALAQNPNFAQAHARLAMIHEARREAEMAGAHRALAHQIRRERRRRRHETPVAEIVLPDVSSIDEHLPSLPAPVGPARKPALASAPAAGPDRDATAGIEAPIIIVSGLPRTGTSLMMQMLEAGGAAVLSDGARGADESNPRGYYELARVKRLPRDNAWLEEARGMAVKVVAPLVPHLPQERGYRVVFMERALEEVVASQGHMLRRLGRVGGGLDEDQLRRILERQVRQARTVLDQHRVPVLTVSYAETLRDPAGSARLVADFLGLEGDVVRMASVVAPDLYREQAAVPAAD